MYQFIYFGPDSGSLYVGTDFEARSIAEAREHAKELAARFEHDAFTLVSIRQNTALQSYLWRFRKEYEPRWVEENQP